MRSIYWKNICVIALRIDIDPISTVHVLHGKIPSSNHILCDIRYESIIQMGAFRPSTESTKKNPSEINRPIWPQFCKPQDSAINNWRQHRAVVAFLALIDLFITWTHYNYCRHQTVNSVTLTRATRVPGAVLALYLAEDRQERYQPGFRFSSPAAGDNSSRILK